MYRINRVGRPVLITVDEVVARAAIDEYADVRLLLNSIEVAEERFIAPVLGDAFYEDFVSRKNVLVTDANKDALVAQINASAAAWGKPAITVADLVTGMWVNAIELVTDAAYVELWHRFLWKVTAEAVDLAGIIPAWLRTTAQGQQLNSPQAVGMGAGGSASGDRKDVQYKLDGMAQNRLYPLIERMKLWICKAGNYPLFDCAGCKAADGISASKGGIVLGIYDDEPAASDWE